MELKEEITRNLKEKADIKYKEFHSGLCPNTDNILGIRVPVLRQYAKELLKKYDYEFLLQNTDDKYYEEIMLQGMIIGLSKEKDFGKIEKYIIEFIPKIDNWAVCDVFCAGLKITKKYKKEMWELIGKYLKSKKEFELRFGIVMILDFYIEENYLQEDFKIFENIIRFQITADDNIFGENTNNVQNFVKKSSLVSIIKRYENIRKYINDTNIYNLDKKQIIDIVLLNSMN